MTRPNFIGIDRKIELDWLDAVAAKAAAGETRAVVQRWLHDELLQDLGGQGLHSAKGKTATVLLRIWFPKDPAAARLRAHALAVLADVEPAERLALHWCMTLCAYPFFGDVVRQLGRLIALQGQTSVREVVRRVAELYGDRTTLPRAVQRVVSSVASWGVVRVERGVVRRSPSIAVDETVGAMIGCALLALRQGANTSLDVLQKDPAAFPFTWSATVCNSFDSVSYFDESRS